MIIIAMLQLVISVEIELKTKLTQNKDELEIPLFGSLTLLEGPKQEWKKQKVITMFVA